jgi:hypothetical protein
MVNTLSNKDNSIQQKSMDRLVVKQQDNTNRRLSLTQDRGSSGDTPGRFTSTEILSYLKYFRRSFDPLHGIER